MRVVVLVLIYLLNLPASSLSQEKVLVSYDGVSGFQGPVWALTDLQVGRKYGLAPEVIMIHGGAMAMQALISGSTHFAQISAAPPISINIRGGDIRIIATSFNKFPFSLVSDKNITSPKDLVNKRIGIVNFGGSNELAVNLALNEWGISPQSVTLLRSGDAPTRLAAVAARRLDATVLSPPYTSEAVRLGMNILGNITNMKAAFPMTSIVVRRQFLEKRRESVKAFLKAYSESVYIFSARKDESLSVLKKRLSQQNDKVLEDTYNYFAPNFSFPPRTDHNGIRNTLQMLSAQIPEIKMNTDVERFLDDSILDELEQEGFFASLRKK